MRIVTKVMTVAATLVLTLSLAAPLEASCGTTALMTNTNTTGQVSFILNPQFQNFPIVPGATLYGIGPYGPYTFGYTPATPAIPPFTSAAKISFWRLGTGDPVVEMGDDYGTYDMIATGGFYYGGYTAGNSPYGNVEYSYLRGGRLVGSWGQLGIDGCVGPAFSCMCLLVTDQDGTDGSWAILGGMANPNFNTFMDIGGTDGVNHLATIRMVNIDAPSITGSTRQANMDVALDVTLEAQDDGIYTQDGCACGPVGFKVLQQILPRGHMPPSDRNITAWTEPNLDTGEPQLVTSFGSTVRVLAACGASGTDVYLSVQLVFEGATPFSTAVVSRNSTRVECGPTLADPDVRPKLRGRQRSDRSTPRKR